MASYTFSISIDSTLTQAIIQRSTDDGTSWSNIYTLTSSNKSTTLTVNSSYKYRISGCLPNTSYYPTGSTFYLDYDTASGGTGREYFDTTDSLTPSRNRTFKAGVRTITVYIKRLSASISAAKLYTKDGNERASIGTTSLGIACSYGENLYYIGGITKVSGKTLPYILNYNLPGETTAGNTLTFNTDTKTIGDFTYDRYLTLSATTPATYYNYKLTKNYNGGFVSSSSTTDITYDPTSGYHTTTATSYQFTLPTSGYRSGYDLQGWSFSSTATSADYTSSLTLYSGNPQRTVYAVWKQKTYTYYLTLDANGGTFETWSSGTRQLSSGTKTTTTHTFNYSDSAYTPTRAGHRFLGWAATSTATSPNSDWATSCTIPNATLTTRNETIYAVWEAITSYSLKLKKNDGTDDTWMGYSASSYNASYSFTLSNSYPTRAGYTCGGWATSASGSASYYAGGSFTCYKANPQRNLYAVWNGNSITISFDLNGGSYPTTISVNYTYNGGTWTVPNVSPSKGLTSTFLGWSESSTATTATYLKGQSYTQFSANKTLYAVYQDLNYFQITYISEGSTYHTNADLISGTSKTFSNPTAPSDYDLDGYRHRFRGWGDNTTTVNPNYSSSITVSTTDYTTKSGNNYYKTVYAVWTVRKLIDAFYWTSNDTTQIASGKNIENLTASAWNDRLIPTIHAVEDGLGWTHSTLPTVKRGERISAAKFNTICHAINALTGSGSVPSDKSAGQAIYASYFVGSGSIKGALNNAVNYVNNL